MNNNMNVTNVRCKQNCFKGKVAQNLTKTMRQVVTNPEWDKKVGVTGATISAAMGVAQVAMDKKAKQNEQRYISKYVSPYNFIKVKEGESLEEKIKALPGYVKTYSAYDEYLHHEFSDGCERRWYDNGQLASEDYPDRTWRKWRKNGQLWQEQLPDGTYHEWHHVDGTLLCEDLPDGTYRRWHRNGQLETEKLPDGTKHVWLENGELQEEELPDGTKHEYDKNGQLETKKLPDIDINTAKRMYKG